MSSPVPESAPARSALPPGGPEGQRPVDEVFSRYLDPALRYVWSQKPARVRSREDALRDGLNCVALAHLVTRDLFGYTLPARLQCLELARDLEHLEPVPDPGRMRTGDLVWFGVDRPAVGLDEFVPQYDGDELANPDDVPVKHVAICTGDDGEDDDRLLLHASSVDGTNALWPLRKFRDYDRLRRIHAIRRLRQEFRAPGAPWTRVRTHSPFCASKRATVRDVAQEDVGS